MIYEISFQILEDFVQNKHGGNVSGAARELDVTVHALGKWLKRERVPNSKDMGRILDYLGARLLAPGEMAPSTAENERRILELQNTVNYLREIVQAHKQSLEFAELAIHRLKSGKRDVAYPVRNESNGRGLLGEQLGPGYDAKGILQEPPGPGNDSKK